MIVLGLDAGSNYIKAVGKEGCDTFLSAINGAKDLLMKKNYENNEGMQFEFEGQKYFAGQLAIHENRANPFMRGGSKANEEVYLRIRFGIARYLYLFHNNEKAVGTTGRKTATSVSGVQELVVCVGQPYSLNREAEQLKMKEELEKEHTVKIWDGKWNEKTITFKIAKLVIASEGPASYYSLPPTEDTMNIIDVGSGTINMSCFIDGRLINQSSDTLPFGMMETDTKKRDITEVVSSINKKANEKEWDYNTTTYLVGGATSLLAPKLKKVFPNLNSDNVIAEIKGKEVELDAIYANAIAFYEIGLMTEVE